MMPQCLFSAKAWEQQCATWLKRWRRSLAARRAYRLWELLTLSFRCFSSWYVIHRSPSLLYATLYEPTNWTRPKSLAPWVMMPVTLVGTSKSTWKKPEKKMQFDWLSRLEIPALKTWMRGENSCLLYLFNNSTPDYLCQVNNTSLYKTISNKT